MGDISPCNISRIFDIELIQVKVCTNKRADQGVQPESFLHVRFCQGDSLKPIFQIRSFLRQFLFRQQRC